MVTPMHVPLESRGGERGTVLIVSLLILSVLMAAGVGAMVLTQTDFKITGNLRNATQAFYLAEAGIEWGKLEVYRSLANPPALPAGAQSFSPGGFSVSFLAPVQLAPLSAKVIIRSTGAVLGSTHTIQAEVTKKYELSDGAVALRGADSRVNFERGPLVVDGRDYDPATGAINAEGEPHDAITVSDQGLQEGVERELDRLRSSAGWADDQATAPAVSRSDFLAPDALAALADDLCQAPHAVSIPIATAGTLSLADQTWGGSAAPELRCIQGLPGPEDAVSFEGRFTGAGILVVKDAPLIVNGAFRWEGLLLVSGPDAGFSVEGDESKEIFGSLVVNQSGPAAAILTLRGAVKVLYSTAALNGAAALIPPPTLEKINGSLPAAITQNYWRVVTP